jgi:GTP-binding protein HflX
LVEAFKATLEEVIEADLLLHVVDISHPQADEQIAAVNAVLHELGALQKPTLMVFNKIDRFQMNGEFVRFREKFPHAVAISAKTGEGIAELLAEIGSALRPVRDFVELKIPHDQPQVMARLHEVAQVVERNYKGKMARFKARIPPHLRREFEPYIATDLQTA